jgi:hypothetical protein
MRRMVGLRRRLRRLRLLVPLDRRMPRLLGEPASFDLKQYRLGRGRHHVPPARLVMLALVSMGRGRLAGQWSIGESAAKIPKDFL